MPKPYGQFIQFWKLCWISIDNSKYPKLQHFFKCWTNLKIAHKLSKIKPIIEQKKVVFTIIIKNFTKWRV